MIKQHLETIKEEADAALVALQRQAPLPMLPGTTLYVPYSSQHEVDARKFRRDCGAACVEMLGEFYRGPAPGVGTDEIHSWITGGVNRNTNKEELQRALKHFYDVDVEAHYNVAPATIREWIDEGKPSIVLVRYGDFPLRMDLAYTSGHWMVVCGYDAFDWCGYEVQRMIVHDPDWYYSFMAQGGFLPVVENMFVGMHKDYNRLALVAK